MDLLQLLTAEGRMHLSQKGDIPNLFPKDEQNVKKV